MLLVVHRCRKVTCHHQIFFRNKKYTSITLKNNANNFIEYHQIIILKNFAVTLHSKTTIFAVSIIFELIVLPHTSFRGKGGGRGSYAHIWSNFGSIMPNHLNLLVITCLLNSYKIFDQNWPKPYAHICA